MNGKSTSVTLKCDALGEREFSVEHAERLLNLKPNGGWELPNNSEFEFVNGTINKRNKKGAQGAEKKG